MATLIPVTQPTNVEAAYEDMFKEITRKLYGEETGNGLHTLGTPVAHVATSGPTAPEGERSFTTLMSDRSLAPTIEYEPNGAPETSQATFKSEDHLTTAFGLAALMQNGFPPTGAILNPQVIPKASAIVTPATSSTNVNNNNNSNNNNNTGNASTVNTNNPNAGTNDQRWVNPSQEIMSWTGGKLASFNGAQKANKSSKNRDQSNEMYHNATGNTNTNTHTGNNNSNRKNKNSNNTNTNNNNNTIQVQKRYSCTHCPYSTDRRDLYTRHENIHKDEKPFQCYACLKQFNRADHVKKHFLRMHRELTYDINKTRRTIPNEQKPGSFLHNSTSGNNPQQMSGAGVDAFINNQRTATNQQQQEASSLSIAQTIESVATAQVSSLPTQMKQEKPSDDKNVAGVKVKREKRFSCCYCPWTGADKWGLKRHLNTHTKPFVCMLCDYKAARSERLATHVLKVHNKKACNKCSFLADNQEEYQAHMNEMHPHDQRPSRNNNNSGNSNNVLRTIGNSLITNNQLNNFQNPSTSFGTVQTSNNGGVSIYTTNDLTGTTTNTNNTNGLQEIVVNPSSMVSWRLSASGSLIPPHIETTTVTGSTSTNSNQKRGAERLFQYLEADGSDPEDYTRLLKMDAISRNTASVAQDFHNAGGVNNYKKIMMNNTSKYLPHQAIQTVAAASHLLYQDNNNTETEYNDNNCIIDENSFLKAMGLQRKAMSTMMVKNNENSIYQQQQQQLMKSPPAYNSSNTSKMNNNNNNNNLPSKGHRLETILQHHQQQEDKENSNSIFTHMEYENLSMIGIQFQNYVKEIINKYYAETPLLYPSSSSSFTSNHTTVSTTSNIAAAATAAAVASHKPKQRSNSDEEAEAINYIEYLRNKGDITLTVTPKIQENNISSSSQSMPSLPPASLSAVSSSSSSSSPLFLISYTQQQQQYHQLLLQQQQQQQFTRINGEKRARKQAQPRKIAQADVIMARLRDKYLKRLVDPKKSCITCNNSSNRKQRILWFPYHSPGSLALHAFWKHSSKPIRCHLCRKKFLKNYSLKIHLRINKHKKR